MSVLQLVHHDGRPVSVVYSSFSLGDELSTNYTLSVSGYSGPAGEDKFDANSGSSMFVSNQMQFSTYDRDNDFRSKGPCAAPGGWWFNHCSSSWMTRDFKGRWGTTGTVVWCVMKLTRH